MKYFKGLKKTTAFAVAITIATSSMWTSTGQVVSAETNEEAVTVVSAEATDEIVTVNGEEKMVYVTGTKPVNGSTGQVGTVEIAFNNDPAVSSVQWRDVTTDPYAPYTLIPFAAQGTPTDYWMMKRNGFNDTIQIWMVSTPLKPGHTYEFLVTGVNFSDYNLRFTVESLPKATMSSPNENSINVDLMTDQIVINFDNWMYHDMTKPGTIVINDGNSDIVTIDGNTTRGIVYTDDSVANTTTATITLSQLAKPVQLQPDTNYTVTVSGYQDRAYNHTMEPYTTTFSTGQGTTPVATLTTPSTTTNVPVDTDITISFSEKVDVTDNIVKLKDSSGASVPFTAVDSTTNEVTSYTIKPDAPLLNNETYTLTVKGFNSTSNGNPMHSTTFTFTTEDVVPPAPAPKATLTTPSTKTDVPVDTDVTVAFNEPVDVTNGSVKLKDSNGNLISTTIVDSTTNGVTEYTIQPDLPLDYSTSYSVAVKGFTSSANGTQMDFAQFNFTTEEEPLPTIPVATLTTPATKTNVPVDTEITITFSEQVDVTDNIIKLKDSSGALVPFTAVDSTTNGVTSYTIQPDAPLLNNETYTLTVKGFNSTSSATPMEFTTFKFTTEI